MISAIVQNGYTLTRVYAIMGLTYSFLRRQPRSFTPSIAMKKQSQSLLFPSSLLRVCAFVILLSSGVISTAVWTPSSARAQEEAEASAAEEKPAPPLNLSPDKSELVRLPREASSVVVGNPAHITVLLDTPTLAVIIPREAGATHFTILDKEGKVIMERHVVVAAPKPNYIRIRRSCANAASGTNCQPTSVYYCPDTCHEIHGGAVGTGSTAETGTTAE